MRLSTVIAKTLKSVDREIARLTAVRSALVSLDEQPHKHFSAAARRRMSIAQAKRRRKEKKTSR